MGTRVRELGYGERRRDLHEQNSKGKLIERENWRELAEKRGFFREEARSPCEREGSPILIWDP